MTLDWNVFLRERNNDMSELRDFRTKLTAESDQMLEAVARSSGRDKSEIVREIVHRWYLDKWNEHQMVGRLFRGCEGVEAASEGIARQMTSPTASY